MSSKALPNFPFLLEAFFTKRLMQQRQVSGHTISSYRDAFRMLLEFSRQRLKKAPSGLRFEEIDAPLIVAFLQDLEKTRGVSARTRNLRLTAVRSFFRFAAFELPDHGSQIHVNSSRKFPIVPFENSPTQNALQRRPTGGAREGSSHEPPFSHKGIRVWNGPEQSRARWFCATKWTLDGEDRSARFEMRKRWPIGRSLAPLAGTSQPSVYPSDGNSPHGC
jgi:hypothetical protein